MLLVHVDDVDHACECESHAKQIINCPSTTLLLRIIYFHETAQHKSRSMEVAEETWMFLSDNDISWSQEEWRIEKEIGLLGAFHLAEAIKCNTTVKKLSLESSNLGQEGTKYLAEALKVNSSVIKLELIQCNIGEVGAKYLAEALRSHPHLQRLNVESNAIGNEGTRLLVEALIMNPRITKLSLENNNLTANAAEYLARLLKSSSTFTELNLRHNNIGNQGAKYLAGGLQSTPSLKRIDLYSTGIGLQGAHHLAVALESNSSIQRISLRDNDIGPEGTRQLAKALQTNSEVQELNLFLCNVGEEGMSYLAEALKTTTSLTTINLRKNNLCSRGLQYFAEALMMNTTLVDINLSWNVTGEEGMKYLAVALKVNASVTTLNLSFNMLGNASAELLADVLKLHTSLEELNLKGNVISDEGAQSLKDGIMHSSSIKKLWLSGNEISPHLLDELAGQLKTAAVQQSVGHHALLKGEARHRASTTPDAMQRPSSAYASTRHGTAKAHPLIPKAVSSSDLWLSELHAELTEKFKDSRSPNTTTAPASSQALNSRHEGNPSIPRPRSSSSIQRPTLTKDIKQVAPKAPTWREKLLRQRQKPCINDPGPSATAAQLVRSSCDDAQNDGTNSTAATTSAIATKAPLCSHIDTKRGQSCARAPVDGATLCRLHQCPKCNQDKSSTEVDCGRHKDDNDADARQSKPLLKDFISAHFDGSKPEELPLSGPVARATLTFVGEGRAGKTSCVNSLLGKVYQVHLESTVGADTQAQVTVDQFNIAGWEQMRATGELARAMRRVLLQEKSSQSDASPATTSPHGVNTKKDATAITLFSSLVETVQQSRSRKRMQRKNSFREAFQRRSSFSARRRSATMPSKMQQTPKPKPKPKPRPRRNSKPQQGGEETLHGDERVDLHKAKQSKPIPAPKPKPQKTRLVLEKRPSLDITTEALKEAIARQGESILLHESSDGTVKDPVVMNIFDLGGQSSFYVFHPFFMNEYSVFPCVFNMVDILDKERQEDALMYLEQWWFMIYHYAFEAPVLLVGTHADKVQTRQQYERIQQILLAKLQNYPHIVKCVQRNEKVNLLFFPVDNTKSDADPGIQTLRAAIAATVAKLQITNVQVPLAWIALYDKLHAEKATRPMLHLDELRAVASTFGMTRADVQVCCQFWHKTGFALHYHAGVDQIVVMDIQWAVNLMTRIIRPFNLHTQDQDRELFDKYPDEWEELTREGWLHPVILQELWKDVDESVQDAFLAVMIRFSLLTPVKLSSSASSLSTHDSDQVLLCPHILPFTLKLDPEGISAWSMSNSAAKTNKYVSIVSAALPQAQSDKQTVYLTISVTPVISSRASKFGDNASVPFSKLQQKGFVPEGLLARVIGALLSLNAGQIHGKPELSRTHCRFIAGECHLELKLVPEIGSIQFSTNAGRAEYLFKEVKDTVRQVIAEVLPDAYILTLLPYSDTELLLFDNVIQAYTQGAPLFVGPNKVVQSQLRDLYGPLLPPIGDLPHYDVFLSHRQSVNSQFALAMHERLSRLQLAVFLDAYNIERGLNFQYSFMKAICKTSVVCPLVSVGVLERMRTFETNDCCDNVLLEWWCAIVVIGIKNSIAAGTATPDIAGAARDKLHLERVYPMFLSNAWSNSLMQKCQLDIDDQHDLDALKDVLPNVVSEKTQSKLKGFLQSYLGPSVLQQKELNYSVREVVDAVFCHDALSCWDATDPSLALKGHGKLVPYTASVDFHSNLQLDKYAQDVYRLARTLPRIAMKQTLPMEDQKQALHPAQSQEESVMQQQQPQQHHTQDCVTRGASSDTSSFQKLDLTEQKDSCQQLQDMMRASGAYSRYLPLVIEHGLSTDLIKLYSPADLMNELGFSEQHAKFFAKWLLEQDQA
eukprot:m.39379 g.39379  ORF g.39379 m.39379 type:complete len:1869 (-) comp10301_c0_seq1:353-5959(-)